ncbi:MAG: 4-hydroxy-tetrahydrodipicolinate synthase [SAR86 cluster bacterium]|uniref:4-hydroxy-tetrahydrodipicolinate synthase n=1 Tax=SAR86 cluster bacterium TaxID=2030880 RepID=A0A937I4N5_9GAMM|nr:4-hydroxy-tetrahydrodipicolinate synthase [SAR86 cluster bacterium]
MQVLQGSLVALVTPLNEDGSVDYDSLKKLIDWHIDEGTNGIVSVGTTGESSTLNVKEHLDVIDFTIKHVGKRIPVIAGTGANATNEAIELSQEAKLKGADYVLLVTPYYNKPNQSGLIKHYEEIANKVDIPQILYNVPSRTACDLKPSSVEILSKHQNIIGIKEAVDDFQRIRELINITQISDDFSIFSGDDPTFLESMSLGAHGVISVAANVIPRSISMICRNVLNSELNEANNLNDINKNLYKLLFVESNPIPVKWMLFKMGLIKNIIRLPLIHLDETYHDEVVSELNKLRLI